MDHMVKFGSLFSGIVLNRGPALNRVLKMQSSIIIPCISGYTMEVLRPGHLLMIKIVGLLMIKCSS